MIAHPAMIKKKFPPSRFFIIVFFLSLSIVGILLTAMIGYFHYRPPVGGDFLLNYRGQEWRFSEHAKALNILYIGYTKCPDVCPLTLSLTAEAFKELRPEETKKVQLLFLSVDQNDRPNDVANYSTNFSSSFLGLTGSQEQIDKTTSQFHASYTIEKNLKSYLGYSITHTDSLYLLDKNGIIKTTVPAPMSSKIILTTIRENL